MSLIRDDTEKRNGIKQHKAKMVVETASFGDTFGPKAQRKRPKLGSSTFGDLAGETVKMHDNYLERLEQAKLLSGAAGGEVEEQDEDGIEDGTLNLAREAIFSKGQSKRIWNELYKVIDASDVIIHVLDARDPLGTRCRAVEKYLKEEAPHKHLIFVLNKCDLVPTSVAVCDVLSSSSNPTFSTQSIPSIKSRILSASHCTFSMKGFCYGFGRTISVCHPRPFWFASQDKENVSSELRPAST